MTEHQYEAGGSRDNFDDEDMMNDRREDGLEEDFLDDIDEAVEEEAEEEIDLAAEASKAGFSSPAEFLAAEIEKLEGEKADLKDQFVRAHAEMENLRRRTAKDVKDARQFSIAGFAREMLAVADNLRRALEAVPQEARDSGDKGFEALIEGVEMTERAMMQGLEKHGVKRLTPANEKFDPNLHQAMFEIPNTEVPNNTVLQVVQDGFVIGERCLRPAMVGVSKGGPKQAANTVDEKPTEQTEENAG